MTDSENVAPANGAESVDDKVVRQLEVSFLWISLKCLNPLVPVSEPSFEILELFTLSVKVKVYDF